MASLFPTTIDSFANPVYTKIDGTDVVSAAHVNDLQDAVIAVQETLAGAGRPLDMASNNFIADNTSFKLMVESLDQATGAVTQALIDHKAATAGVEHFADVISVTAQGYLTSVNVQDALLEHQSDIDKIMTGDFVNGVTLDNRYVVKFGAQQMDGPLHVTQDLVIDGDSTLGTDSSDTIIINGVLNIAGNTVISGIVNFEDDIHIHTGKKIADHDSVDGEYILFETDRIEFYSHKDFIFRLDADDGVDGASEDGLFIIKNGVDANILELNETGELSVASSVSSNSLNAAVEIVINGLKITESKIDSAQESLHIQLDKGNASTDERFFITRNNDTGNNLASTDMLFNLDKDGNITSGIHILKSGIQETGYFGLKVMSGNATGVFYGSGVNFKHQMTNSPSSVTLVPDANSFNYDNLSITDINEFGFFFEFDTPAVGAARVSGTYVTVGN